MKRELGAGVSDIAHFGVMVVAFHFPSLIFSIFEIYQSNYLQRKSVMVLEIRMYRDRTFIFIEYSAIEQYLSRLIIAH